MRMYWEKWTHCEHHYTISEKKHNRRGGQSRKENPNLSYIYRNKDIIA